MVIGCRRSNVVFTDPSPVALPTGDPIASFELDDPEGVFTVEGVDLKGAFYHLELPEQLRRFFATRPALAGAAGASEVDGHKVAPSAK
eukprot:7703002-Pyramimonas_sp.AAC.1